MADTHTHTRTHMMCAVKHTCTRAAARPRMEFWRWALLMRSLSVWELASKCHTRKRSPSLMQSPMYGAAMCAQLAVISLFTPQSSHVSARQHAHGAAPSPIPSPTDHRVSMPAGPRTRHLARKHVQRRQHANTHSARQRGRWRMAGMCHEDGNRVSARWQPCVALTPRHATPRHDMGAQSLELGPVDVVLDLEVLLSVALVGIAARAAARGR